MEAEYFNNRHRSGRLDMSGLTETELRDGEPGEQEWEMRDVCDWCEGPRGKGYVVVAGNRCDAVCPICWGRSPVYLELREEGFTHEAALARLGMVLQ